MGRQPPRANILSPPLDIGQYLEHFWLSQLYRGRPGTLLNTLQYTGQRPTAKSDPAPDVRSASPLVTHVISFHMTQLTIDINAHMSMGIGL